MHNCKHIISLLFTFVLITPYALATQTTDTAIQAALGTGLGYVTATVRTSMFNSIITYSAHKSALSDREKLFLRIVTIIGTEIAREKIANALDKACSSQSTPTAHPMPDRQTDSSDIVNHVEMPKTIKSRSSVIRNASRITSAGFTLLPYLNFTPSAHLSLRSKNTKCHWKEKPVSVIHYSSENLPDILKYRWGSSESSAQYWSDGRLRTDGFE